MNRRKVCTLLLILIILLAAFLRFYDLANNPPGINQDEAVNGYDAYSLGLSLHDHHGAFMPVLLESFGDWVPPVLTYFTTPFVKIFGLNDFGVRFPIALSGVLTVFLMYLLVNEIFQKKEFGLLSALLLAISPLHIHMTRWAIPPSIVPFFLTLALLFLVKGLKVFKNPNKKKYFILTGISSILFAVTTYSYPTMNMFIPIILLIFYFVFFGFSLKKIKLNFKYIFFPLVVYCLLVSPIAILSVSNPDRYQFRYSQISIFGRDQNPLYIFLKNYISYFSFDYLFQKGGYAIWQSVPGFGIMNGFESGFFYLGIISMFLATQKESIMKISGPNFRKFIIVILFWFAIYPLTGSLTIDCRHTLRTIQVLPILPIITGFGIWTTYMLLNSVISLKRRNLFRVIFIIILVIIAVENLITFSAYYFGKYKQDARSAFQGGIREVMDYIRPIEVNYSEIAFDRSINSAYIYPLYYLKIDPKTLDQNDLDNEQEGWIRVDKVGKFKFIELNENEFNSSNLLKVVEFDGESFYKIYDQNNVLYINRVDNES